MPQGSVLRPNLHTKNSNDLFLFLLLDIANYAAVAPTISQVISELKAESHVLLKWMTMGQWPLGKSRQIHLLLSVPSNRDVGGTVLVEAVKRLSDETAL